MKKVLLIPVLILFVLNNNVKVVAQNNCECTICHVPCNSPLSAHKNPNCPVYQSLHKSSSSSTSTTTSSTNSSSTTLNALLKIATNSNSNSNANTAGDGFDKKMDNDPQDAALRSVTTKKVHKANDDTQVVDLSDLKDPYSAKVDLNVLKGIKKIDSKYKSHKDSSIVQNEQNLLDSDTQTWVEYQKEQFKIRLEQPNYWCKKYYEDLEKQESLTNENSDYKSESVPPKKLSEVQAGDVILIGPTDSWLSKQQAKIDAELNDNDANFTHTVTCVKVIGDEKLYLDNQFGEGPKIIDEQTFKDLYGKRTSEVAQMRKEEWGIAQPLNDEEAKKLWNKATELYDKNKENLEYEYDDQTNKMVSKKNYLSNNYGLIGDDNLVCSEASWKLVNASGRYKIAGLDDSKLISKMGISFSPASFYNARQYFIITPLDSSH